MDIQRFHQQFTESSDPLISALRRVIEHATPQQAQAAAGDWLLWGVNERSHVQLAIWDVWSTRNSEESLAWWFLWLEQPSAT
jgi:hypothetical protein